MLLTIPCQAETIVCFPMDSDPGWTAEGQWEFGVPQGAGGPQSYDPTAGHTGTNVYGYNLAGNYEDNMPEYCLTTSALNCKLAENVKLSFWRWLGVESSVFDHAKIEVSNDGTNWTDVWTNSKDDLIDSSWIYCEYDISAVADRQTEVFVRWCMGPTDSSGAYAGWNIDDVCLVGDLLDPLFISPTDVFFSLGPEGGPFSPVCKSYTLTNNGDSALNWNATGTQSWLEVTPSAGTLAPDSNVTAYICISDANTLSEDIYTGTASFTNTNTGFSHEIEAILSVGDSLIVPLQYPTVQSAIDAAVHGNTIIVMDGTYRGGINFKGKAITLKSANGPDRCGLGLSTVRFNHGEDNQSVLEGFTLSVGEHGIYCENSSPVIMNCVVKNMDNYEGSGAGMYNKNSSPTLVDCSFINNLASVGGGMYNSNSNPMLFNCIFKGNSVDELDFGRGAGMYNSSSHPYLFNCIFTGNRAYGGGAGAYAGYGGGMYNNLSNPVLTNCTFSKNNAGGEGTGGGLENYNSKPTLINCILWGNSDVGGTREAAQIYTRGAGSPTINYSCVQNWSGSLGGTGNIGDDPLFVTGPSGDYYLSQIAAGQEVNSPCVDAGSDLASYLGMDILTTRTDQGVDLGIVDMGYHYTIPPPSPADIDEDGDVDFADYAILADQWQQPPGTPSADIAPPGGNGIVDIYDLDLLVEHWLWGK